MTNYLQTLRTPSTSPSPTYAAQLAQHAIALAAPRSAFERSIVGMVEGWARYADAHAKANDAGIGADGVLGPEWAELGMCIRRLLNGETGRLDCGTLSSFIGDTLRAEGFNPDRM